MPVDFDEQRETDHNAPFRDVMGETDADVAQRAQGIDPARLRAWFERFRKYTHPATYGQSGCDRLFNYCYRKWGPPPTCRHCGGLGNVQTGNGMAARCDRCAGTGIAPHAAPERRPGGAS